MEYEEMKKQVKELGFIQDDETADAALKAVWRVIASTVDEDTTQQFTSELPYRPRERCARLFL